MNAGTLDKIALFKHSCNTQLGRGNGKAWEVNHSYPVGNYDNPHRSQPIRILLFRVPFTFYAILKLQPQFVKSL